MIGFIDPSPLPNNPAWPLRNLLAYLRFAHPPSFTSCQQRMNRLGIVTGGGGEGVEGKPAGAVGSEKNVQNKLGPRVADLLAPTVDPIRFVPLPPSPYPHTNAW
jgi:ubiquitin-like modifier-activating enzyme ATG7